MYDDIDDLTHQLRQLKKYRNNLLLNLQTKKHYGNGYVPDIIINSIKDTRDVIKQIKLHLERNHGVFEDDAPYDIEGDIP